MFGSASRRRRPPSPPEPVTALAADVPLGRLLGWGITVDGGYVLAGEAGLHLPAEMAEPQGVAGLVSWDLIDKVTWRRPSLVLQVRPRPAARPRPLKVTLAEPEYLSRVVEDRVIASVVVSRRHRIVGEAGAVFVARRTPQGRVRWTVVADPELDTGDPRVRGELQERLAEIRSSLGM